MAAAETTPAPASKAKRVRTGCLTCRSRHLKCDEATPDCMNCRKSHRECKRGVRLNFIDITTEQPPVILKAPDFKVVFHDESRNIASEYAGGVEKYRPYGPVPTPPSTVSGSPISNQQNSLPQAQPTLSVSPSTSVAPSQAHPRTQQQLPPIQPTAPNNPPNTPFGAPSPLQNCPLYTTTPSQSISSVPRTIFSSSTRSSYGSPSELSMATPSREGRGPKRHLDNAEETLFMQVFVEEVGIWMDSLDSSKHFSRILPFTALNEPMLLNAFLACGARHLSLVNAYYPEDKALGYYDTATRLILDSLQNEHRDQQSTEMCATTAVILNVYEIMSEGPLQRMNHIAGARALIKECQWNAQTKGVGGACFWLNVSLELLSCLRFKWAVAWHPDQWGVDMDFTRPTESVPEELWAHRIIYILAKIACFSEACNRENSNKPVSGSLDPYQLQKQYDEWCQLRQLCDTWNDHIPVNMHPMAILHPYQTAAKSPFPEIWLIKRRAIVARLFYHTALLVLARIHPYLNDESERLAMQHAHNICGIVSHVKDRGVATVALRSLALAGEVLERTHERQSVLETFQTIAKETGWRIERVLRELKQVWGWDTSLSDVPPLQSPAAVLRNSRHTQALQQLTPTVSPAYAPHIGQQQQQAQQQQRIEQQSRTPLVNPLMAATDLNSLMNAHPYYPHYQPPPPQGPRSPTLNRHGYN